GAVGDSDPDALDAPVRTDQADVLLGMLELHLPFGADDVEVPGGLPLRGHPAPIELDHRVAVPHDRRPTQLAAVLRTLDHARAGHLGVAEWPEDVVGHVQAVDGVRGEPASAGDLRLRPPARIAAWTILRRAHTMRVEPAPLRCADRTAGDHVEQGLHAWPVAG